MKITFILPGIGRKKKDRYLRSWLMEPLTIAVLSALTPAHFEREFYDDRVEDINYESDADIIAISVETYTAKRAYYIAGEFRRRGKIIIMGGYHPTLVPTEAAAHCDIVLRGNAEKLWAGMLADIEAGSYKREYSGSFSMNYKIPDRSIYAKKRNKYLPISLVEAGRGCYHNCSFCSIRAYYGGRYLHRPVEDIVAEMKSARHKLFFIVDDSIFSDRTFARQLFTEIRKLKIVWTTQITLDFAADKELLALMKDSGCEMVLIGFESVDSGNLKQMNKEWSEKLGRRDELVQNVHDAGIGIYASFVFGFDEDNKESFESIFAFAMKHRFYIAAFNHLLTFPGTGTYRNFAAEGRMDGSAWWLEAGYTFGTIAFKPKQLSPEKLREFCAAYKRRFFSFSAIRKRGAALFRRTKSLKMNGIFWIMNLLFHFEVDKRLGIPMGENLDCRNGAGK